MACLLYTSARGGDEIFAGHLAPLGQSQAVAPLCPGDGGHLGIKGELQLVPQSLVDIGEDAQIILCAQVLTPGLKRVEVKGQGPAGQSLGLWGLGGEYLVSGPVTDAVSYTHLDVYKRQLLPPEQYLKLLPSHP